MLVSLATRTLARYGLGHWAHATKRLCHAWSAAHVIQAHRTCPGSFGAVRLRQPTIRLPGAALTAAHGVH